MVQNYFVDKVIFGDGADYPSMASLKGKIVSFGDKEVRIPNMLLFGVQCGLEVSMDHYS